MTVIILVNSCHFPILKKEVTVLSNLQPRSHGRSHSDRQLLHGFEEMQSGSGFDSDFDHDQRVETFYTSDGPSDRNGHSGSDGDGGDTEARYFFFNITSM